MTEFSTLPFLLAFEIGAFVWLWRRAGLRAGTLAALLLPLTAWVSATVAASASGWMRSETFLGLWPGFLLPVTPILLVALACVWPPLRRDLTTLARRTPARIWIALQIPRLAAIGTLIKTLRGEFPVHVQLAIGLGDLAFGASALLLYWLAGRRLLSADALVLWHAVGIAVVVLPGELAIQAGLPGPFFIFDRPPTAEVMLELPMVLAPAFVVPVLLMFNALGIVAALAERSREAMERPSGGGEVASIS
ncbi:MAG: hypothetical protein AAGN46_06835 [Acidobacteriota bacterium]